jgi:hypothetical protein
MLRADASDGRIDGTIDGVDFSAIIGDIDLTLLSGGLPVTGSELTFDNTAIPCFAGGTRIATSQGLIPIQALRVGDFVQTRDNGLKEMLWIGSRLVPAVGRMAPVLFAAGVLGNSRPLYVSPNHRMLLCGWQAELYLGEYEVLQPAKWLLNLPGVEQQSGGMVEYFHLLFDQHEVVLSEEAWTESFHPGQVGLTAFETDTRNELLSLFPDLAAANGQQRYGPTARLVPNAAEGKLFSKSLNR